MHETVLIVDDERAIANLTALWIRNAGLQPILAYDGKGALEQARAHHPNVILLDIRMPDLDGFEVQRQLKESTELRDIPVIFLSAHAQETTRQEATACGAACFLSKPYECKNLIAATRMAISSREQKPQNIAGTDSRRHELLGAHT